MHKFYSVFILLTGRDFNNTIIEQIIPPNLSGFSQSFPFDLTITPDDILEPDEVFLILLNFADETGIDIGRRCAVGRIQGSNNARINCKNVFQLVVFCNLTFSFTCSPTSDNTALSRHSQCAAQRACRKFRLV